MVATYSIPTIRPTDSQVLKKARDAKRRLLAREEDATRYFVGQWESTRDTLTDAFATFAEDVRRRREMGMVVADWRLKKLETYQSLVKQAEREVNRFYGIASGKISGMVEEYVQLGAIDAGELLAFISGDQSLGATFSLLPRGALTEIMASTISGSPLDQLLHEIPFSEVWSGVPKALRNGIALGKNPRVVAREMANTMTLPLNRAMTIARTETLHAYRRASSAQYKASGVVTGYKRLAAHDERTCPACLATDGMKFELEDEFAEHPNGRCTLVPLLFDYEPQFESGEIWLARQSAEVQKRILGPTRFAAYEKGMPLSKMWKQVGDPDGKWPPAMVMKSLDELKLSRTSSVQEPVVPKGPIMHGSTQTVYLQDAKLSDQFADMKLHRYNTNDWEGKPSRKFKTTREVVERRLHDVLGDEENKLAVRVHRANLGKIFKDGRLKTQFETNRSGGMLNHANRATAEQKMFGMPDNFPASDRPIYGYLSPGITQANENSLDQYGDVRIVLKRKAMANRTTFTYGDSLGAEVKPSLIESPSVASIDYPGNISQILSESPVPDMNRFQYIELQFQGQVTVDDIDYIEFTSAPPESALVQKMLELGLTWIH